MTPGNARQDLPNSARRRLIHLGFYFFIALVLFALQRVVFPRAYCRRPPFILDSVEVHNIAWNLAHGRGYRFDWDAADWRRLYEAQNADGVYDRSLSRHGSYPTLSRPPLMPMLVAGCMMIYPGGNVFEAWRIIEMALCAAAGSLLCATAVGCAGRWAGALVLIAFWYDPIRWMYVPGRWTTGLGWWTEGLAFPLLSVLCWLLVSRSRWTKSMRTRRLLAGVTLGLLCLDRSVFVLTIPAVCVLFAMAESSTVSNWRGRAGSAALIAAAAILVQAPWWARNIIVAGRFLPLGTQGGFNLPDEYGDVAVRDRGVWSGEGMRDVWLPAGASALSVPPGYTEDSITKLAPGDRRLALLTIAYSCTSTASEVAVCHAGTHAALRWAAEHPGQLPELFADKIIALVQIDPPLLAVAAGIIAIGFWRSPKHRRVLTLLCAWVAVYSVAVGLTHMESVRFLIPAMPALYLAVAIAAVAIVRGSREGKQTSNRKNEELRNEK